MKGLYDQYKGTGFVVDIANEDGVELKSTAQEVFSSEAKADLDEIPF